MAKETTDVALVTIDEKKKVAIFNDQKEFDALLKSIREKVGELVPDVSTAKGRDDIRSMAYKVTRTKTLIDDAGKGLKADAQKLVDAIDSSRRKYRDTLDALQEETRAPLTAWEHEDKKRTDALQASIDTMKRLAEVPYGEGANEIRGRLRELKALHPGDRDYEEFQDQAEARFAATKNLLDLALASAEEREQKEAELAELRRQEAERTKKELQERQEREAAEAAAHKSQEEERRRVEQERAAERAEADRRDREQREENDRLRAEAAAATAAAKAADERAERAAAAERERIEAEEAEKKRIAAEERAAEDRKKRLRDQRNKMMLETLNDVENVGISKEHGQELIKRIMAGEIRHINFG